MFNCVDKKGELKKLNRSILICFLELLDILIDNPASPAVSCLATNISCVNMIPNLFQRNQKIKDLTDLFINMHHLINEFRPHQASML